MRDIKRHMLILLLCISAVSVQTGCTKNNDKENGTDKESVNSGEASSEKDSKENEGDDDKNSDTAAEQAEPVSAGVNVSRIEGISEDFICGADISTVKVEYESGVKYYDFDGNELMYEPADDEKGFFDFMKKCGLNWVRIRVWNNPYDEEGHGYGGGNNDLETAKEIGKLATDAGLRVLIDFHYSDFWADPDKYEVPKEWKDMDIDEKKEALDTYTVESLTDLIDSGVDVGMVQVGNETVNGLAGETDWENICGLMNEGSKAVRYVADTMEKEILVALHFTDISESKYDTIAATLKDNQVDYDVFATSYYPFWHGTTENLTNVMSMIAEKYGKKVMVAETSYVYTLKDGDGHTQSVGEDFSLPDDYEASIQGQTDAIADVIQSVVNMGGEGIGVFYWEPAWIPVNVYNEKDKDAKKVLELNKKIWEEKGSGWASRYAGSYDADDAGKWYGGSSWDNQALFDFEGHPLESAKVFSYVYTGAVISDGVNSNK